MSPREGEKESSIAGVEAASDEEAAAGEESRQGFEALVMKLGLGI